MPSLKRILCIADAPGPAEFLLSVIPLLQERYAASIIAVGTADRVFANIPHQIANDEATGERMYRDAGPDLLVVAISSLIDGPYVNNRLIECAATDSVPTICLEDFWANHRWPTNRRMIAHYRAVCVLDEFAAKLWREDGFRGAIQVTGNPAFDRFATVDVAAERNRLRGQMGIGRDDRVIYYAGQGARDERIPADRATFAFLADVIRALHDPALRLIVRPHPRAREIGYYAEFSRGMNVIIDTSTVSFTEELLPAADIIISMSGTNLIHACYLRIPAVSILLPDAGRSILQQLGLDDFPPNTSGASIGVYKPVTEKLSLLIERILTDSAYRSAIRHTQEEYFLADGRAAERVATAVNQFAAAK